METKSTASAGRLNRRVSFGRIPATRALWADARNTPTSRRRSARSADVSTAILLITIGGIEGRQVLANRSRCLLRLRKLIGCSPGIRFFLSTSALIRLASTENASPPTSPEAMHIATTPSNTRRNASLSRNRSCLARQNNRMIGKSCHCAVAHVLLDISCDLANDPRTARDASSGFGQLIGCSPGIRFFLSTSALIRLASTENASPRPVRRRCIRTSWHGH